MAKAGKTDELALARARIRYLEGAAGELAAENRRLTERAAHLAGLLAGAGRPVTDTDAAG